MPVIWILNGIMNAGGTESLIMELLRNKPNNIDIKLIIHIHGEQKIGVFDQEIKEIGIPIYYLPSVGSVGFKKYQKAFRELIEKIGKPDVIHSNMNAVGGFICKVAKQCGIKQRIVHCHADIKYRGSIFSRLKNEVGLYIMKKYVNHYANHYWACSVVAAKRLFYKDKKYIIIPNIINVQKYFHDIDQRIYERKKLGVSEDTLVVGAVGRIAPIKNYEIIIDAISILKSSQKKVHFYCYGSFSDDKFFKKLRSRVAEKNVEDRIHFLGNSMHIAQNLNAFDVFVMPSISEGFGISAVQAQAASLPTLLSMGVPQETDMGLGLVHRIRSNDAQEWAEAILNSTQIELQRDKILQVFQEKGYDSKTKCKDIYQIYENMVKENGAN